MENPLPKTSSPLHVKWLKNTHEVYKTNDGKNVVVWELAYEDDDDEVMSLWAQYFRKQYCADEEIDVLRDGTGLSRSEFLTNYVFPDGKEDFGPGVRAGDFGEILISDYLEFILRFWVPRTRHSSKTVRNESVKGTDVIGFKFFKEGEESPSDILATIEAKAQFSGTKPKPRLQDAVNDSAMDNVRKGESLSAIKRRLIAMNRIGDAKRVARFQNPPDHPYREITGAAALFSADIFDPKTIITTTTNSHPNSGNLMLIVIRGNNFMNLVHELYRRAADEA